MYNYTNLGKYIFHFFTLVAKTPLIAPPPPPTHTRNGLQELSSSSISQWKKEAMRSSLKTLKKFVIDGDKLFKAKLEKQVSP